MAASKPVDLILDGAGLTGAAFAGAYAELYEQGFRVERIAGSSAGALVAALIAAEYSPEEVTDLTVEPPWPRILDPSRSRRFPSLGRRSPLFTGLYRGAGLHGWIGELLERRGVRTFADLVRDPGETDPRYRYRLQVIASDVTLRRLLLLPCDGGELGLDDPDDLEVALAVRMSMSIPVLLEPVLHRNPKTDSATLIVDGSVFSNFPVWLFDRQSGEDPEWPTFGLLLVDPERRATLAARIGQPQERDTHGEDVDYLQVLAQTLLAAHHRLYLDQSDFGRTIPIPSLGANELRMSLEGARAVHEAGRQAAQKFLRTWDFAAYVVSFRPSEHSRRSSIVQAMSGTSGGDFNWRE